MKTQTLHLTIISLWIEPTFSTSTYMAEKFKNGLDLKNEALFQFALGNKEATIDLLRKACQAWDFQLQNLTCGGSTGHDTADISRNLKQCMIYFEKVKSGKDLLTRDESLLYLSSKMGEFKIYPWTDDPLSSYFSDTDAPFTDTNLYKMKTEGLSWSHISETPIAGLLDKWERYPKIYQDAFHDCSVVSSLTSMICLSERCENAFSYPDEHIYPFKKSPSRKYLVKLHISGTERAVEVDDQFFPAETRQDDKISYLFLRSTAIWPILIEKAYMKATGGYKFQGSHAALDTFILCGWIPEIIDLNDCFDEKTKNQVWNRISIGWANHDVLACLGTSDNIGSDEELIPMHDYSIIDVDPNAQTVRIRNPWFQKQSESKETPINFDSILKKFRFLYLNWNPKLLPFKMEQHFIWPVLRLKMSLNSSAFVSCPQFSIVNDKNHPVLAYMLLQQHNFRLDKPQNIFLGVRLYKDEISRLHTSCEDLEWLRSQEIDAPYTMLRCEIPPQTSLMAVITARQDVSGKKEFEIGATTFTFSVSSDRRLRMAKAEDEFGHKFSDHGRWTTDCIGGNWADPNYGKNPQYSLKCKEASTFIKIYASSRAPQPIALHLFASNPKRTQVHKFYEKALMADSGKYTTDHCCIKTRVPKGEYVVVLSTYEKSDIDMSPYYLECVSENSVIIKPVVRERAGMFKRTMAKEWQGKNRFAISVRSPRLCEAQLDLITIIKEGDYHPSLRLSVFEGETLVASNNAFCDDISGVTLYDLIFKADITYIIIMERLERGEGSAELSLYTLESALMIEEINES